MKLMNIFRNFILNLWAERPFWQFMAILIVFTLFVVFVFSLAYLGVSYNATATDLRETVSGPSFSSCFERSFLTLVTLSGDAGFCTGGRLSVERVLTYFQLMFGVFFFASVVALFTVVLLKPKKIFELKSNLNIRVKNNKLELVCSAYNGSPVTVSELSVLIIARVRINDNTLKNVVLKDGAPSQSLAEPYIPLRFIVDLEANNTAVTKVDSKHCVCDVRWNNVDEGTWFSVEEFYVDIRGSLVEVEQSVHLQKRYFVKGGEVFYGKHHSVDPDYDYARRRGLFTRLKAATGFVAEFERNGAVIPSGDVKKYVFGYGSLVDSTSFSRTLQRDEWFVEDFPLTTLKGYKRVWNVAMDNSVSLPGYKRYRSLDDGDFPDCFVSFLNLEKSAEDSVIGCMVQVTDAEFKRLLEREKNYTAENVTASIENCPIDSEVIAFVGSENARQRFDSGRGSKPVIINESYLRLVENAYRSRGKVAYDNYISATDRDSTLKVKALESVQQ